MTESCLYNAYCGESCRLENDGTPVMALGAVTCPKREVRDVAESIRALKVAHGLKPGFEAKWTKVSPARASFYTELIGFFLGDERLRFRGLVVPDKSLSDHLCFGQSRQDWYCKMYRTMLLPIFTAPHRYHIYLGVNDTRGGSRSRQLHDEIANSLVDPDRQTVERVQQVRSHESELLQVTDLLIGALTYTNRGLDTSSAKVAIVERLREGVGQQALSRTFSSSKLNILVWQPKKEAMNIPSMPSSPRSVIHGQSA